MLPSRVESRGELGMSWNVVSLVTANVVLLTVYMLVMNLVVAMLGHPRSCTSFDLQLVAKVMSHLSTL